MRNEVEDNDLSGYNALLTLSLLTAEEEVRLAQRMEAGDHSARDSFVEANMRLVMHIARKFIGQGVSLADLVQEGSVGLIKAVDRYEWRKGYRFSTLATWWIRQAIGRAIDEQSPPVHIPSYMAERIKQFRKLRAYFSTSLARDPLDEELAAHLNVSVEQVQELRYLVRAQTSVSLDVAEEEAGSSLREILVDEPSALSDPDMALDALSCKMEVEALLVKLSPRERQIIELRYGLFDGQERTLQEVARLLQVTRERIRQVEAKALAQLRDARRT